MVKLMLKQGGGGEQSHPITALRFSPAPISFAGVTVRMAARGGGRTPGCHFK